jgi:hypothetical protein
VRDSDARLPRLDSELQFINGDTPEAWYYENDSDDTPEWLLWLSPEGLRHLKGMDRFLEQDVGRYFTIYPRAEEDGTERLYMELWPTPTDAGVIEMMLWTRPDALEADGTTDDQSLIIPDRPVYQLALMYAINERGEELGEPGNLSERRYINALGAAIEKDINSYQRADRYDWRRD